ncbi:hypothetical protein SAMN05216215_11203 [Saccharopolyspora shandongensis]|uniref:Uncharacterized protein n=1 Tax=Saccharopolyspora shandongensis TaxID=418495 RepID=A0A1H3U9G4_9PSEU|nr:hypothetical protein [Saccharopolyspora shandongensis]SDZ59056.1 hypothetical protein SAMN05216215_11203 [Saccharopolyspora shandongensis]
MDVAGPLAAVLPQAGIGGVLLFLLVVVMRHASTDRSDYRTELDRMRAAYVAELTELRERADELAAQLEDERRKRWKAEDSAARARRGAT